MCHFFVIILSKFGRMGNAIFLYQGGEFLEILQIRHNAQRLRSEIVQYTHGICVQSQNCVQKPFRSSGFPGAREARERSRPVRAAVHFPAPFSWCRRVALAIRRFRAGGTVSKRIDTPYGGFYPLGTPSSALFGKRRSDGTQAFLLRGGTEKGERQYRYQLVGSA